MSLKYIEYKGKKILYVDYRNKNGIENMATIDAAAKEIGSWTQKGLSLSDFRNATATPEFMAHLKKVGAEVFQPKAKIAVLGITGVKNILLQAYNAFTKNEVVPFETEEEAKEWLIKD